MAVLRFRCPASFNEVKTGIETDEATLRKMAPMKLSLWCPHCGESHEIMAGDAFVHAPVAA